MNEENIAKLDFLLWELELSATLIYDSLVLELGDPFERE